MSRTLLSAESLVSTETSSALLSETGSTSKTSALMAKASSSALMATSLVILSTARVSVTTLSAALSGTSNNIEGFLDRFWDWGRSWQMVSNRLEAILISYVLEGDDLTIIGCVRESTLGGCSEFLSNLFRVTLFLSLDSVSSFVAK